MVLGIAIELLGLSISASRWILVNGYYGGRYLIYGPEKNPLETRIELLEKQQELLSQSRENFNFPISSEIERKKLFSLIPLELPVDTWWLILIKEGKYQEKIQVENLSLGLQRIIELLEKGQGNGEFTIDSNLEYLLLQVEKSDEYRIWFSSVGKGKLES